MNRVQEICVASHLTNLASIAGFVADQARRAGLKEDDVFAVQMAVDEACTNTIEHAYGGRGEGEVRVCCFVEGDDFVVRISDYGAPFDPSLVPAPDIEAPLEDREVGGLGLFLMRRLMDRVDFCADPDDGNQVTMRKKRGAR